MSKICKICGAYKDISDFYTGRSKCKDCTNTAARKKWKEDTETSDRYKKRNRERKKERQYGITQQQYNQMLVDQNNKCKICSIEFKSSKFTHIDHCHDTNRVRGLLCNDCNLSLGQFMDNIEYMCNAIEYLKK
jgi:hypothetical protein